MGAYYLKLYAITLAAFLAIDLVWLGVVARTFYRNQLGSLLSEKPNWVAALMFYGLFIVGLLVFAVVPGLQASSWKKAIGLAAFFGLITYATYDLTNLATLRDWPWLVSIVDMCWGVILASSVAGISYAAGQWMQVAR